MDSELSSRIWVWQFLEGDEYIHFTKKSSKRIEKRYQKYLITVIRTAVIRKLAAKNKDSEIFAKPKNRKMLFHFGMMICTDCLGIMRSIRRICLNDT